MISLIQKERRWKTVHSMSAVNIKKKDKNKGCPNLSRCDQIENKYIYVYTENSR